MATQKTIQKISAKCLLDGGLDPNTQKQITLSTSIGTLSTSATADQVMAVIQALGPCLQATPIRNEMAETYTITEVA